MSSPPDHEPPVLHNGPVKARPKPRFREVALASGLVTVDQLEACEAQARAGIGPPAKGGRPPTDEALAKCLVKNGTLTEFQAKQLLEGRKKLTLGQYRIMDELGRGGMGQVFRAIHTLMDRTVAVKVLPRKKSTPESEDAFRREIRMLSRLVHEHLVLALDAGYDGRVFYLVTEFVPGLDLKYQVKDYGPLDEPHVASIISQAARGLAYAHAQGVVHRDMKPANLLVTPGGSVKVLDLGLAGSTIEGESVRLGRVVGTVDYMAPEQIRSPDTVGPLGDIYALGCTAYYALTGEVPFPGGTRPEKAQRQLKEQPRPLRQLRPDLSVGLCRVIEAMMQKDPRDRPPSAEAVVERLRPWTPELPLEMPRVRAQRSSSSREISSAGEAARPLELPSVRQGSSEDAGAEATSGAGPLWSVLEENDEEVATVVSGPGWLLMRARALFWSLSKQSLIAAIVSIVFVTVLALISRIEPEAAGRLFGAAGLSIVGVGTFGLLIAIQMIVAATREDH